MNKTKILNFLETKLNAQRLRHVLSVAELAGQLAAKQGENVKNAEIAALLHDAAKYMTDNELVKYCLKHKIKVKHFKKIALAAPHLLHADVSAFMAKNIFAVENLNIINAIKHHTAAVPKMGMLAKIIFVADFCAEGRTYKGAQALRRLALKNMDKAFKKVLFKKISYVLKKGLWLSPESIAAWNYYNSENI
jgi:predicted HD superfamily hydrolase involved in NAD metabolism